MRNFLAILLSVCLSTGVTGQGLSAGQKVQMQTADVVILGENHDNSAHHEGQAALMREIGPKAVVFEMLTPAMATQVNAWDGDLADLGDAIGWEVVGWPDFAIYLPVFEALGGAVAIGAATPRAEVRDAFELGAASVFGAGAARFGLTQDLNTQESLTRETMQFDAHCGAMPLEMMGGMVEAQRLRDAQFSAATLKALETNGAPVVVITGNGHARRDWAMPFVIAQAAPEISTFSIGFVETPTEDEDPRFDVTIVTDPAPRGDPCAAFNN